MSVAAKRWDLRKNKVWSSQEFTAKRESGRKSTDGITAQNLSPIHQRACLVPTRTELSHFSVLMQCLERQPLHPISLNSSMSLGAHLVLLFPSLSVHMTILYICIPISAMQTSSSIPFF